jgi:hypothetical protein
MARDALHGKGRANGACRKKALGTQQLAISSQQSAVSSQQLAVSTQQSANQQNKNGAGNAANL